MRGGAVENPQNHEGVGPTGGHIPLPLLSMPSFTDVGDYLERNRLESELSELVATCVEDEIPQPLPHLADAFRERAREVAVDWDYHRLTDELRQLIAEKKGAGALFSGLGPRVGWITCGG